MGITDKMYGYKNQAAAYPDKSHDIKDGYICCVFLRRGCDWSSHLRRYLNDNPPIWHFYVGRIVHAVFFRFGTRCGFRL